MPENVEVAKQEIEAHIAQRTGAGLIDRDLDFAANGTDVLENGEPVEADKSDKNHSLRAMEALHKLSKLTPSYGFDFNFSSEALATLSLFLSCLRPKI